MIIIIERPSFNKSSKLVKAIFNFNISIVKRYSASYIG